MKIKVYTYTLFILGPFLGFSYSITQAQIPQKSDSIVSTSMSLSQVQTELGDKYFREGKFDSAYQYYKSVITSNQFDKKAHQRIVSLYANQKYPADTIIQHCLQLTDIRFKDIAANALEVLIMQNYSDNEDQAEKALVWWLSLRNKISSINTYLIQKIPTGWHESAPVSELEHLVSDPIQSVDLAWWTRQNDFMIDNTLALHPRFIIGETIYSMGKNEHQGGNIELAMRYYEKAYDVIANGNPDNLLYDPDKIPDVFFTLSGDLGIMYAQSERYQSKFRNLENDLFGGKGMAYFESDIKVIQKFHAILGLIYAERGKWEGPFARNAEFQLRNAIEKAPDGLNVGYLQQILASGYEQLGAKSQAIQYYIEASKSYLNNDNLKTTARIIDKSRILLNNQPSKELDAVNSLFVLRSEIQNFDRATLADKDAVEAQMDKIFQEQRPNNSFIKSQKFKIYADLGSRANVLEMQKEKNYFHSRALREMYSTEVLYSIADVQRIEEARITVLESIGINNEINHVVGIKELRRDQINSHEKSWNIYLSDVSEPGQVTVTEDLFTGAELLENFYRNDIPLTEFPKIQIDDRKINIDIKEVYDEKSLSGWLQGVAAVKGKEISIQFREGN